MTAEGRGRSFRRLSRTWYLGCCLLDAMKYGRWEDVYALTKITDLDPNVLMPEYGIAPMHCAAGIEPEEFGLKCVQEFLNIGGDPNVKCSEGVTPVHVACCWNRTKVLNCLLRRGGDPYLMDDEGNDAFYYAEDKGKIIQLLVDLDNKKIESVQAGGALLPTGNLSRSTNCTSEEYQDLNLNVEAYSLMLKHRKSVFIFESFPEDDTASSTTLETEGVEDFAYNPKEVGESTVYVGCIGHNIFPEVGHLETWTNKSDDEICTENILEADKTHVIQVINENINKSMSASSLSDGKSDVKGDRNSKESVRPKSAWSELRRSRHSETSLEELASNYERADSPLKRNYSQLVDESSTVSGVKSEERLEQFDNGSVHPDNAWTDLRYSCNFDTSHVDSGNNCEQEGTSCGKTEVKTIDGSSTNILGITVSSDKINRTTSRTDSISSTKKKSRSSYSSMKSVSEETNYRTPLESKELDKVLRVSSHESITSIKCDTKLPKNLRDTLKNFKVNTHYRSRTRVLRMTSKSCDGFKIKKSLYCTGFEFWSSKVRSRSYPSSTAPRRAMEK